MGWPARLCVLTQGNSAHDHRLGRRPGLPCHLAARGIGPPLSRPRRSAARRYRKRHRILRDQPRRVHPRDRGCRHGDGRIGRDHGISDGAPRPYAAGAGPGRSELRRVPAIPPSRRGGAGDADQYRRRRAHPRARGGEEELERGLGIGGLRETDAAGDTPACRAPYMAGDSFTAADISITYALQFARRTGFHTPGEAERDYIARTTARNAYARAMDSCPGTKAWAASLGEG